MYEYHGDGGAGQSALVNFKYSFIFNGIFEV